MLEGPRVRHEAILNTPVENLMGYHFSTPGEATAASLQMIEKAKGDAVVFFDIDYTLFKSEQWIRKMGLNAFFRKQLPDFKSVSLESVVSSGGRYYQVPTYTDAARALGRDFYEIFTSEVAANEVLHALMSTYSGATDLQRKFGDSNIPVVGYPTARPHALSRVTSSALMHHGFANAPVIDVSADSGNPQHAKAEFYLKNVLPHVQGGTIYHIDDHVDTALSIQELCDGAVTPIVPIVPRNRASIPLLQERGIITGNFEEIAAKIGV